jgi:hypothetical protein
VAVLAAVVAGSGLSPTSTGPASTLTGFATLAFTFSLASLAAFASLSFAYGVEPLPLLLVVLGLLVRLPLSPLSISVLRLLFSNAEMAESQGCRLSRGLVQVSQRFHFFLHLV